jgi:hypothetical protein
MSLNKNVERNVARNNALDRAFQGVGAAALTALAYQDVLHHFIRAVYPLNYVLAGGAIIFIGYMIIAPLFRK